MSIHLFKKKKSFFSKELNKVQQNEYLRSKYTIALNETIEAEKLRNNLFDFFDMSHGPFEKAIQKFEIEKVAAIQGVREKSDKYKVIQNDPDLSAVWKKEFYAPYMAKMTAFEELRYDMKILDVIRNRDLYRGLVVLYVKGFEEKIMNIDQTEFDKDTALEAIFGLLSSASPLGNLAALVENLLNLGKSILIGKEKVNTHAADQTLAYLDDYALTVMVWNGMAKEMVNQIQDYVSSFS